VDPTSRGVDADRDQPAGTEDEDAGQGIEDEVVGGDDDGNEGEDRVEDGQHLVHGPPQYGHQGAGAPQGPGEVEAGHRRVLIGDLVHRRGVE
jgi:hypothetical protein